MIPAKVIAVLVTLVAPTLALAQGSARGGTSGDWGWEFGQGNYVASTDVSVDRLEVFCRPAFADTEAQIYMQNNRTVHSGPLDFVFYDGKVVPTIMESGTVSSGGSAAGRRIIADILDRMRRGRSVTLRDETGFGATFSLLGAASALEPC